MAYRGMQMEPLDIDGLFWLPDKADDKVAGRLKLAPTTWYGRLKANSEPQRDSSFLSNGVA